MKRTALTKNQLRTIRRYAGKMSDRQIGERMGLKGPCVAYFREKHGIPGLKPGGMFVRWTPEKLAIVYQKYIVEGLSAREVGRLCGEDDASVRRRASQSGWKRDPAAGHANRAKNPIGRTRKLKAPKIPPSRFIGANDAELIAEFMARKGATILPDGHACGTTAWEAALGTAKAPGTGWVEQAKRNRAALAATLADEARKAKAA